MESCSSAILARCESGQPFTQEEPIELLDSTQEVVGIASTFLKNLTNNSLSVAVVNQFEAGAELEANRHQKLSRQLGGGNARSTRQSNLLNRSQEIAVAIITGPYC